jgi:adenylate cyclase
MAARRNLGDVIAEGEDLFGDGVNVAARSEALAEPGGVLVSNTVHDHVRDRLPFAFEDLGEHQVKNIARPVRVYRVRDEDVPTAKASLAAGQPPPLGLCGSSRSRMASTHGSGAIATAGRNRQAGAAP